MTVSTNRLGQFGEDVAVRHVEALGWRVLRRNWRVADGATRGEIDVVAADGPVLVFCEVKTRRGGAVAVDALAAVDPGKQRRLRRLAAAYLAREGHADEVRFDVVAVWWPRNGGAVRIAHVKGAF